MKITNAAVSAIAMFAGSGWTPAALSQWAEEHGTGVVECYIDLAHYAGISGAIFDSADALPSLNMPGVYTYEVDEQFGKAWAFHCARLGEHEAPDVQVLARELGRLAFEFFNRPDVLNPHEWEQLKAVIKVATGYSL